MILFHRTSIGEAREIVHHGFVDEKWAFKVRGAVGEPTKLVGVWLSDRPLNEQEGPDGDAVLEVTIGLSEDALNRFEVESVFWDARLWVVPSELLNPHVSVRILHVDPRSSWFFEAADDELEEEPEDDDAEDEGWREA
jgi:hypothetical protein